jgi:ATP-dependent Clp protease ATP-binding subunit ClpA
VIVKCGANPDEIKREIHDYLEKNVEPKSDPLSPIKVTASFDRLIQQSAISVNSAGKAEIEVTDVLVSMLQSEECFGRFSLEKNGVNRFKVVKALTELSAPSPAVSPPPAPGQSSDFLVDLNERAKAGKVDPLIGRELEVERVIQILCRRKKNNPILVGEPGVGKTAIAEGLALRIENKNVPKALEGSKIYSLDLGMMMAGTKYRGDFEERMKEVIKKIRGEKGAILFIDEIHTIIGAGAVGGGSLDAGNMLKPILTSGEFKCIGSTTYKEYTSIFEKEPALSRRFQKVDVNEPSVEDTVKILTGIKVDLEKHHHVKYTSSAIKSAVLLSNKYITDRFLPDKAIDILDEAGSMVYLQGGKTVNETIIEKTISKIAKIPEKTVTRSQKDKLLGLEKDLKGKIFGQDQAVAAVVSAIELASSGLRSGEKPIGSFLFAGPTGVGKTELCKQLASSMGVKFIRFDMSEYMEKHSVARLIGAPPGYVGYDQGGLLTDEVRKNPNSVILLDEIEKAHPDVWNILLQVMDHGTLTDNNGKKADFRHSVLVMTSNVGARESNKRSLGLAATETKDTSNAGRAIEVAFSPEFRNRLDSIVWFNALGKATIVEVVEKYLKEVKTQLQEKGVTIAVSPEAKDWLAAKGYDPAMGARPMIRLIQDKVKRPLSSEILYGRLEHGGHVELGVEGSELKFEYFPIKKRVEVEQE